MLPLLALFGFALPRHVLATVGYGRPYVDVEAEIRYIRSQSQRQQRFLLPNEKCIDSLGCFGLDGVWGQRSANLLPSDRSVIDTQFFLYTRSNPTTAQMLVAEKSDSFLKSNFDGHKETKVVIHGFLESSYAEWFPRFTAELLKAGDFNVINVNWGGLGGSKTLYTQATANTRVVGAEVALLVNALISLAGASSARFHVIGHSLGAHIAGYAGERISKLARITGMDPAEPYFENMDIQIRLDTTDALFVDVIHTDGNSILQLPMGKGGLGLKQAIGHADYYANGGEAQPNCDSGVFDIISYEKGLYEGTKNFVACDHMRAVELFIYSINYCDFSGYSCSTYEAFQAGTCGLSCEADVDSCNKMGLHAHKPKSAQRSYFLNTAGQEPYCATSYLVTVEIDANSASKTGKILVNLKGKSGTTGLVAMTDNTTQYNPGQAYSSVLTASVEVGQLVAVDIQWQLDLNWWRVISKTCYGLRFCSSDILVKKVTVVKEQESSVTAFCSNGVALVADKTKTFQSPLAGSSC